MYIHIVCRQVNSLLPWQAGIIKETFVHISKEPISYGVFANMEILSEICSQCGGREKYEIHPCEMILN